MSKYNFTGKIFIVTSIFVASFFITSCKDNMISNVYLNLTNNSTYEDHSELNTGNEIIKIRVKDFYTNEAIAGATVKLVFPDGLTVTNISDNKGAVEIQKQTIPAEDFDIHACYSKNNNQYYSIQKVFYTENFERTVEILLIHGNCEIVNN